MRKLVTVLAGLTLAASASAADRIVLKDRVNVRAQPSLQAEVVGHLGRDERVPTLEREGEWVKIPHREGTAYVHASLLSSEAYAELRRGFDYRVRRVEETTGVKFFHHISELDGRRLRLVASDEWLRQPEEGRRDNLRVILRLWREALGEQAPERLEILVVDQKGKQHMQQEDAGA